MRWFQLSFVVVSNANGRMPARSSMRMPPRSVTAASDAVPRVSATGSPGSRANSAMAPKVPRLHCVSASAICASRNAAKSLVMTSAVMTPRRAPSAVRSRSWSRG